MWIEEGDSNPWGMFDTGSAAAQTGGSFLGSLGSLAGHLSPIVSLGSALGGMFGGKGDSSAKAFARQMRMLNVQQSWQENMMRDQYSLQTQGLRQAGLNPMLAVSKGFGGGPSSPTPSGVIDPAASEASSAQAASSKTLMGIAAQKAVAEIGQIQAQTRNIDQQTKVGVQEEALKNAEHNAQQALSSWYQQQGFESTERIKGFGIQRDLATQHIKESIARASQFVASAKLADAQTSTEKWRASLTATELDAAQAILEGQLLEGEIDQTRFGEAMRYLRRVSTSITGLGSNAKSLVGR